MAYPAECENGPDTSRQRTRSGPQPPIYSVGLLWGGVGANYYLLDCVRVRLEAPELRRLVLDSKRAWDPNVTLVEDTELGRTLVQEIRRTTDYRPRLVRPRGAKTARLEAHAPAVEAGRVHIARSHGWFESYRKELLAFPYGAHDDQVDATSQALNYLAQRTAHERSRVRRNMPRREVTRRDVDVDPESDLERPRRPRFDGPPGLG